MSTISSASCIVRGSSLSRWTVSVLVTRTKAKKNRCWINSKQAKCFPTVPFKRQNRTITEQKEKKMSNQLSFPPPTWLLLVWPKTSWPVSVVSKIIEFPSNSVWQQQFRRSRWTTAGTGDTRFLLLIFNSIPVINKFRFYSIKKRQRCGGSFWPKQKQRRRNKSLLVLLQVSQVAKVHSIRWKWGK